MLQSCGEIAQAMKETWSRKRAQSEESASFSPTVTSRAARRNPRSFADLSEGDRLRQEYHKVFPTSIPLLAMASDLNRPCLFSASICSVYYRLG